MTPRRSGGTAPVRRPGGSGIYQRRRPIVVDTQNLDPDVP